MWGGRSQTAVSVELLRSPESCALRPRRKHLLGGGEAPRRRWEQSLRAKEFILPKRVQRVIAVLARFGIEEAEERPSSALPVAGWSLASVPHSSASLAEPTRGRRAAAASPAKRPAMVQSAAVARPRLPCSPLRAVNQCGSGQWAAGPGVR